MRAKALKSQTKANYIREPGEMGAVHPQGPGHLSDLRHTMCQQQIESAGRNSRFSSHTHTQTHRCSWGGQALLLGH